MGVTIIGSFLSPYVRKVLGSLRLKSIAYEVDSTAICEYLEERPRTRRS